MTKRGAPIPGLHRTLTCALRYRLRLRRDRRPGRSAVLARRVAAAETVDADADCLCSACLKAALARQN